MRLSFSNLNPKIVEQIAHKNMSMKKQKLKEAKEVLQKTPPKRKNKVLEKFQNKHKQLSKSPAKECQRLHRKLNRDLDNVVASSSVSVRSSRSSKKDRKSQTELGFIRLNDNSKCNESSNSSRRQRNRASRKSSMSNNMDDLKGDLVKIES